VEIHRLYGDFFSTEPRNGLDRRSLGPLVAMAISFQGNLGTVADEFGNRANIYAGAQALRCEWLSKIVNSKLAPNIDLICASSGGFGRPVFPTGCKSTCR
jgi:hypothetical protein